MNRTRGVALAFAVLMYPLAAVPTSANLITYEWWQSRRGRVMVMDETGTAVTELYACDRGVPCGIDPSISPPAPDGTAWIAFNGWDLYKIRMDGSTDPIMILCHEGTDIDGDLYQLAHGPQWSPDGMQLLVQTQSYLALLDADFVVGPDCASPLEPIHSYDWLSGEPEGWNLEGHAAWNDDGSKIAFFEGFFELGEDLPLLNRLVILEREETGDWIQRTIYPEPALPIATLFDIDWQRGGALLAFASKDATGGRKLMWVNPDTLKSGYLLNNGSPLEGRSPSWSPDGSQLIFDDLRERLFKWSYVASTFPDGPVEAMGSGHRSDWQRNPLRIACDAGSPCDDGKECTTDTCVSGYCEFTPLDVGSCGNGGWCVEGECFEPECEFDEDCDDLNDCTVDRCSNYRCSFDSGAVEGLVCDDGDDCTSGDACDGAGGCAGTFDPNLCEPVGGLPGDPCTTGADCISGRCHPKKHVCR